MWKRHRDHQGDDVIGVRDGVQECTCAHTLKRTRTGDRTCMWLEWLSPTAGPLHLLAKFSSSLPPDIQFSSPEAIGHLLIFICNYSLDVSLILLYFRASAFLRYNSNPAVLLDLPNSTASHRLYSSLACLTRV